MLSIFIHTSNKNIYLTHTFIIGGFEVHERLYLRGLTVNSIMIDAINM
jgi:hypothetical protein